jgi:hypothetical protein
VQNNLRVKDRSASSGQASTTQFGSATGTGSSGTSTGSGSGSKTSTGR